MSNIQAPFGFRESRRVPGGDQNFSVLSRKIASADANPTFKGDVLVSLATGYVTLNTPGTTQVAGVAIGFAWNSRSYGGYNWFKYWPGNGDAIGDVDVLINVDPMAVFQVQAGATVITQAAIGNNIQYVTGTGNTLNGISGAYLGAAATTNTLPFKVISLVQQPACDPTSAYNTVEVTFNNQDFKSLTGI